MLDLNTLLYSQKSGPILHLHSPKLPIRIKPLRQDRKRCEAAQYLMLYLQERKNGNRRKKPENLTDESPLIRGETKAIPKSITPKQIRYIVHQLYVKANLVKQCEGHYDLRAHSLRKYFKTQMLALGVQPDYVDFFMGHTLDTYHDIQSVGIERLRNVYASAGLAIRQKTTFSKLEQLKEMVRALGMNPEQVLTKNALADGAITVKQIEDSQLTICAVYVIFD